MTTEAPPDIVSPPKLLSHDCPRLSSPHGTREEEPLMCGLSAICVKEAHNMESTYPIQKASAAVNHCEGTAL